jgi:CDP-diacylglycerol--serine O-phosphatidyltransferase
MGVIKRRLGWIPNLFTLGNLTLGFFAILLASRAHTNDGLLVVAAVLILLAMLCDGLDGFAARLLHARSELGAQLDSLADLTAFGIAPAVLFYNFVLHDYNYEVSSTLIVPTGMLLSAIYPACAAYRLARFNVVHDDQGFVGLPSPVAGVAVALMPLAFGQLIHIPGPILTVIFVLAAFLMVSTIRYAKPQAVVLRRFSPLRLGILLVSLLVGLVFVGWRYGLDYSAAGIFSIITIYTATGLVSLIIHAIQEYRM